MGLPDVQMCDLNSRATSWYRGAMEQTGGSPLRTLAAPTPTRDLDEDAAVVTAVAGGDREAVATLYDRHAQRLTTLVDRILGDSAQAKDVVHDVFVEAWHHAAEFDPRRGSVRAWLTTRARCRALDRVGHRERGARALFMAGVETTAATVGATELETRHDAAVLRSSVVGLPADLAQLVEGAYYEGMSASALAARFSIPVGTVKSRLARALVHLRDQLDSPSLMGRRR
jgi:RNA polymerase sigma-70 factor (ECF subfamily)